MTGINCKNCQQGIVFGRYWMGTNPEWLWYHPPGNRTCLTRPHDWPTGQQWPSAEPALDPQFVAQLEEFMDENDGALRRLADGS